MFRCTITNGPWTRVAVAANSLSLRLSDINDSGGWGTDSRHGAFERTTSLHGQPLGPTVIGVSVSLPGDDGLWRKGGTLANTENDNVEVTYTFSEPVKVTGSGEATPTMRARLGKVTYEFPYNRVEDGGRKVVFRMVWKWGVPPHTDVPDNWNAGFVTVPPNALSLHRETDSYFGYDGAGVIASMSTGRLANLRHAEVTVTPSTVCRRTPAVRDAIVAAIEGVDHCANVTDAHLRAITELVIPRNSLQTSGLRAGDFAGLTALTGLSLERTALTTLPAGIFDGLGALTDLYLNGNDLTALPADVFDQLTALATLDLASNDLTALPADVFDQLTALEWLNLASNDLTALPADVFDQLTALAELYLFGNDLTALPADVFDQLTALTKLHLSGNDLTALPADVFDQLTALTELYLSGNDLTTLPADVFGQLTALTELYLSGNDLTTLPAGIFDQLTALTRLNLSGNDLTALPADVFENLTALFRNGLDFSNNPGTSTFTPVANAGEDATATTGAAVSLSGSSTGPWGNNVTWSWTQVTSAGFTYNDDDVRQLTGRDTPSPSFTAPSTAGDLYFELTVTARGILTIFTTDTVKVTVTATSNQVAAPSITGTAILPELAMGPGAKARR